MAEGTGDLTESKARNPRLRAEPTSDTPCPPRGPHHPVLTASLFLSLPPCVPSSSLSLYLFRARARVSLAALSRPCRVLLVGTCACAASSLLSPLRRRSTSFSSSVFAERPTAVCGLHREFALASRGPATPPATRSNCTCSAPRVRGDERRSAEKRRKQTRNRCRGTAASDGGGFSREIGNRTRGYQ